MSKKMILHFVTPDDKHFNVVVRYSDDIGTTLDEVRKKRPELFPKDKSIVLKRDLVYGPMCLTKPWAHYKIKEGSHIFMDYAVKGYESSGHE